MVGGGGGHYIKENDFFHYAKVVIDCELAFLTLLHVTFKKVLGDPKQPKAIKN